MNQLDFPRRDALRWLFAVVFLVALVGMSLDAGQVVAQASSRPTETVLQGTTMGPIEWRVVIGDEIADASGDELQAEVQQVLDRVNELMSTYRPDSDVTRFNRAAAGEWVAVDPSVVAVIQRAKEISEATQGAFDITVGPAVNRWSFGPDAVESFPSEAELKELQRVVGYSKLEVRESPAAIKKAVEGVQIDLSAIAKGYAVDRVAERLIELGITNAMVEVGGEVMALGEKSAGQPWRIGIEAPEVGVRRVARVALLSNAAMATSGDYRNFRIVEGRRISHTIDPRICRPVENDMASACVVAGDCMTADALATAAMVVGLDDPDGDGQAEIFKIIDRFGGKGYFVRHEGAGFAESWMDGFPFSADGPLASEPAAAANSIWPTFIAAAAIFLIAVIAMAVGAIFGNRPIQGSCGGIAIREGEDGTRACGLCQKPISECPEKGKRNSATAGAVADPAEDSRSTAV